ncbi:core-2/I-branching enzyme, partial [Escherichia coli]
YYDMYKHSLCGDEVFFHTLLKHLNVTDIYHNTTMINDALRYIDWTTGPEYPRMLNEKDIEQIKKSGCIFARKFSDDINQEHFSYLLSVD